MRQKFIDLCYLVEKLPASEQQTELSVKASECRQIYYNTESQLNYVLEEVAKSLNLMKSSPFDTVQYVRDLVKYLEHMLE